MKKALAALLLVFCLTVLVSNAVLAAGGKEHGSVGNGYVNQEDPVGPGDQPDWQD